MPVVLFLLGAFCGTSPGFAQGKDSVVRSGEADATNAADIHGQRLKKEVLPGVRLVVTGDTWGISSGTFNLDLMHHLNRVAENLRIVTEDGESVLKRGKTRPVYAGPGAATDGEVVLFRLGGLSSDELIQFLGAPPFERVVVEEKLRIMEDQDAFVVTHRSRSFVAQDPFLEEAVKGLRANLREVRLVSWQNKRGEVVFALEPGEARASLDTHVHAWELVPSEIQEFFWEGEDPLQALVLGKIWDEGSRRLALVQDACEEAKRANQECLVMDAGNALDGYSFRDGQATSLHRPTDWDALEAGGCRLLSPSFHELLVLPAKLGEEAREHGVELLSANLAQKGGDLWFRPYSIVREAGRSVVVVGLTDPSVRAKLPFEVEQEVVFWDPAESLKRALEGAKKELGGDADLVVVLTLIPMAEIESAFPGVDMVFGDFRLPQFEAVSRIDRPSRTSQRVRVPFLLHHGWAGQVAVVDVDFAEEREGVLETRTRVLPVAPHLRRLDGWVERVLKVREDVFSGTEAILVPNLAQAIRADAVLLEALRLREPYKKAPSARAFQEMLDANPPNINRRFWTHLVANLVRDRFEADIALIRDLPPHYESAGALRVLDVMSRLAVPDRMVVYEMTGAQVRNLQTLLQKFPRGVVPHVSGVDAATGRVGGRNIDDARIYRVLTTDQFARGAGESLFEGIVRLERFEVDGWDVREERTGEPLSLKSAVVQGLRVLQARERGSQHRLPAPDTPYAMEMVRLMKPGGKELEPLWTFRVKRLSVSVQQNSQYADAERYQEVRVTRATVQDNLHYELAGDFSLERDTADWTWIARARGAFGEIRPEGENTETNDDLVLQTEGRLNALSLTGSRATVPVVPFMDVRFDTEFTRLEEAAERQKEVQEVLGVIARFPWAFQEGKFGLLGKQDLASDDPLELGVELKGLYKKSMGGFSFQGDFTLDYFFPDDNDGPDDLGLILQSRGTVRAPMFDRFSLGFFVDAFVFQGKVEQTDDLGVNLLFGVDLGYDRAFVLGR